MRRFGYSVEKQNNQISENDRHVLNELSQKIQFEGNLWIIVGILQILSVFGIIAGVYNLVVSSKNRKYAKEILEKPVAIYPTFEPIRGCIFNFVFNFVFGTFIGIAGSLYHIFGIREYVIRNKDVFERLDAAYSSISGTQRYSYDGDLS